MMETESQIVKGSSDKYNLNNDYVKVLHKRFGSSIGTIVTGFIKATITSTSGECTQFYATLASKDTHGMIGHLFIFKK
jgi:hypothetical protein